MARAASVSRNRQSIECLGVVFIFNSTHHRFDGVHGGLFIEPSRREQPGEPGGGLTSRLTGLHLGQLDFHQPPGVVVYRWTNIDENLGDDFVGHSGDDEFAFDEEPSSGAPGSGELDEGPGKGAVIDESSGFEFGQGRFNEGRIGAISQEAFAQLCP